MKAWQLIERIGWCTEYEAIDKNGDCASSLLPEEQLNGLCLLGALNRAYGFSASQYVNMIFHKLQRAPEHWNDAPGRTKEEVIALLKELDI